MRAFAALLDALAFAPSPAVQVRLMADYLKRAPDFDRGWALAMLAGGFDTACVRPAALHALAAERVDAEFLRLSLDFVGDPVETAALIWPESGTEPCPPPLAEVAPALSSISRQAAPGLLARWFDRSDLPVRRALAQLAAGRRVPGVTPRLARTALAAAFSADLGAIEEAWHGQAPPYGHLFAWLEGRAPHPEAVAGFRPLMPVCPLDETALASLDPACCRVERQWSGMRVQLVAESGLHRLYSGSGDDVSRLFPEIVAAMEGLAGVFDGVLMAACGPDGPPYRPAPPEALARRLGRKTVPRRLVAEVPVFVRLFDMLFDGGEDIRPLPLRERRARLEARIANRTRLDLSPVLAFEAAEAQDAPLVLKPADAPYLPVGPPWRVRKAPPKTVRALLLAARPGGTGERGPDYSVALLRDGAPVAVGDAPCRLESVERDRLDRWVRAHVTGRYGPVRAVEPALVLEVAFETVRPAPRRKAGLALTRPEIVRILWDLPADAADSVDALNAPVSRPPTAGRASRSLPSGSR
ncbi:MAG: ATP-dependent DNA ligase [Alphaproteobacteria bacterium]|nr:ATP-dependent DNA ligase [Alphaproteobacteria bacterium]